MHHVTSDVSLAVASVYDSTQKAMDFSDKFFDLKTDKNMANITNIEWLGETEEEAIRGGPNGNGVVVSDGSVVVNDGMIASDGMIADDGPNEIITEVQKQEEDNNSLLAYALAVPILVVLASLLFLTKTQKKRKARTKEQLFGVRGFENALIGTGDHPDSFHEGMYHYNPDGVRYLSTNCPTCIETKQNGFFTAGELDTISEHAIEEDDTDRSIYRQRNLVSPSSKDLGGKHSSIDVHNCSSARCAICAYKLGLHQQDVEFITKSEDFCEIILEEGEQEV